MSRTQLIILAAMRAGYIWGHYLREAKRTAADCGESQTAACALHARPIVHPVVGQASPK